MNRASFVVPVILGLAVVALHGAQQPEFRAAAPTVSIDATVLDRDGRVVTNLERGDFEVFDNGRAQPLTVFDNGLRPITIVIMLDRSGSVRSQFGRIRDAAKAFVANVLPGDRVRIGSFADQIRIDPETFTEDRAEMNRILDDKLLPAGGTPLWSATARAFDALAGEEGRRVALIFTDGRDTPALAASTSYREILQRARTEETMVYAIGLSNICTSRSVNPPPRPPGTWYPQVGRAPRGGARPPQFPGPQMPVPGPWPGRGIPPRTPPPQMPRPWADTCRDTRPDPDLRELADEGGGGYFELGSTDDLASTFERIAYELHSQYLLAFVAPELDGRPHQIEVRVKRPGVTVRARKGYVAGE